MSLFRSEMEFLKLRQLSLLQWTVVAHIKLQSHATAFFYTVYYKLQQV